MAAESHPLLSIYWHNLCSWDGQASAWAVRHLRLAVEEQADERPGPSFTALLRDLDAIALGLMRGVTSGGSSSSAVAGDTNRVLGGIRTLEALVQVGDGHAASSESKSAGGAERRRAFAIELRKILEGGGDAGGVKGGRKGLLDVAAGAVGGLSRACSGEMQVLEREFARPAMELIRNAGPKGEGQRYAGALVLRELAEHAPAVLYDRRTAFFEDVWMVINDLTSAVRIRAAAALGAMLLLVHERQSTATFSRLVLGKVAEGFEQGTAERIHGSLLAIRQLLRHPGPWMAHRYQHRRRRYSTEEFPPPASFYVPAFAPGSSADGGGGGIQTPAPIGARSSNSTPQMPPPAARGGVTAADSAAISGGVKGASTQPPLPSGGASSSSSTASTTRGFFFPAGGQGADGAAGLGGVASRQVVIPPPPSPHRVTSVSGMVGGGGGGAAAIAAAAAAAATAAVEEEQELEFRALCAKVLAKRDHKEAAVRRTVMALLPELAAFFPGGAGELLEPSVWFLIQTLRKGQRSDRGLAYLSLARLGLAAGPGLWMRAPALWHSVREVVKEGLAEDRKDFCPQSLACLEMMIIIGSASENDAASLPGRVSPAPPSAPSSPTAGVRPSPANSIGSYADAGVSSSSSLPPPPAAVIVGVVLHSDESTTSAIKGNMATLATVGVEDSFTTTDATAAATAGSALPQRPPLSAATSEEDLLSAMPTADDEHPTMQPIPGDASGLPPGSASSTVPHADLAESGDDGTTTATAAAAAAVAVVATSSAESHSAAGAAASAAVAAVSTGARVETGPAVSAVGRTTPSAAPATVAAGVQGAAGAVAKKPALLDDDAYELVDRVFNGGLSHALVQTLTVLAERTPALQPEVQARLLRMVGNVLQQFVPRSWGSTGSGLGVPVGGMGFMLGLRAVGVGGMPAGGLSSPPAHGVVGGMEGLSLVCESPRANRKTSGGGSGGGGGGGLMWSAEGGRQLETWRSLLFPAPGTKPDTSAQVSYSDRGLGDTDTGRRDAYVGTLGGSDDAPMSTGDISVFGGGGGCGGGGSGGGGGGGGGSYGFHDRYDSYGVYFSDMSSASAPTPRLSVAEKPGKFWDLYGSAEEGEGSPGNVVLALDVLGSFDFYSIPAVDGGGAHEPGTRGGGPWSGGAAEREVAQVYRQEMLGRAMRLLHTHALRCLDDADERIRVAACSACCRLLARAAVDARSRSYRAGKLGIGSGGSRVGGDGGGGVRSGKETPVVTGGGGGGSGTNTPRSSTPTLGEIPGDGTIVTPVSRSGFGGSSGLAGLSAVGGGGGGGGGEGFAEGPALESGRGRQRRIRLSLSDDRIGGLLRETGAFSGWGDGFGGGFKGDGVAAWVRRACMEVLERLLTVGLSDEAASVRQEVVVGLEANQVLDPLVALPSNVRCLFEAINDETLAVRRGAARLIGRASRQQSTVVVPFVRVALMQLGQHLEVSQDATVKKERVLVLTDMLASAGSLVRPYISSIMPQLLRELLGSSARGLGPPAISTQRSGGVSGGGGGGKASGGGVRHQRSGQGRMSAVVTAVLRAMGALAVVSPRDVLPVLDGVLLPAIVRSLQDHTSVVKQEAAVKALGQVVGATGAVVGPYFSHPQLLDTLLVALQRGGKSADGLRLEV